MKYVAFAVALLAGVPAMAGFAMSSERRRALLLALLVFAPVLAEPLWLDRLVVFLEPASGAAFVRGEDFVFKGMA